MSTVGAELMTVSKSAIHFLPQSTVSLRSDSYSEASSSCCHRSDV